MIIISLFLYLIYFDFLVKNGWILNSLDYWAKSGSLCVFLLFLSRLLSIEVFIFRNHLIPLTLKYGEYSKAITKLNYTFSFMVFLTLFLWVL